MEHQHHLAVGEPGLAGWGFVQQLEFDTRIAAGDAHVVGGRLRGDGQGKEQSGEDQDDPGWE
ncbi:hypothetical protein TSO221_09900 [Azospirillum sp. TSO22-1]|nr:hypothetical protein TSO221_09900 [Azospirillum sp. TSO22-1]